MGKPLFKSEPEYVKRVARQNGWIVAWLLAPMLFFIAATATKWWEFTVGIVFALLVHCSAIRMIEWGNRPDKPNDGP